MGFWVIFAHEHVGLLLRNKTLSVLQIDFGPASPLHDSMLGQDMPDHTRLRRATNEWFNPEAVEKYRSSIRTRISKILDKAQESGSIEAVYDLAYPMTHGLMCEILDVPDDGTTTIRDKTFDFGLSLGPGANDEDLAATAAAADWFTNYIKGLIAEKHKHPGTGMLDAMMKLQDAGEMTENEVVSTTFLFFAVGHLDVSYLILNGLRLMSEDKKILQRYMEDPESRALIINEILRFDTPEQFVSRLTTEEIQVGDVTIPAGEMMLLMIGAANKDPKVFENANEFQYDRPNAGRHLAFSGGIHGCVGQILARAEADEVFLAFGERFKEIAPAEAPTWGHTEFIRALHKLPLSLK